MPPSIRPASLILWFAIGGLALAVWLSVFAKDLKRPVLIQERVDRLASENYLAGSLQAESPPSPAHWAQLLVWQNPANGLRYPLSRDASALAITIAGGNSTVASTLAFALAAGSLGWLFSILPPLGPSRSATIGLMVMLGVAKGRDWQMTDPFPFLVLAAATLAFCAWLRQRETPTKTGAWMMGFTLAGLVLCDTALAVFFLIVIGADKLIAKKHSPHARMHTLGSLGIRQIVVVLSLLTLGYAARNHLVTGNLLVTPGSAYRESSVTAPQWFWESTQIPQAKLDPVFERFDELIAIPAAHWSPPVYRAWLNRLYEGASYAGGLVIATAALFALFLLPGRDTRPALFLIIGMGALALLRYGLSSTWWPMLTPAIVVLATAGLHKFARNFTQSQTNRLLAAACVIQIAILPVAAHAKPSTAEYDYLRRIKEITDRIQQKNGKHLVFASLEGETDGRIEPADLPRVWADEPVLIARDLGTAKNASLVAAMPDRTPWRVLIMPNKAGLQSYSQTPASSPAPNPPIQ